MKVKNIIFRCLIALALSVYFGIIYTIVLMIGENFLELPYEYEDALLSFYMIFIMIVPIIVTIFTLITEIKIYKYKIKDEIKDKDKVIKKYGLDKYDIDTKCHELFVDYLKYVYYKDNISIQRILGQDCYNNYVLNYDKYNKLSLGEKYNILNFNLVNIKEKEGKLFLEYEIKVFHSIKYQRINLNNRSMIAYKLTYSFVPIINQKNCPKCGSVLKNSYRCHYCHTLLDYDCYNLMINFIEMMDIIDRWC